MDLSLERWDGISEAEQTRMARQVAGQLPAGFAFLEVRRFRLGEQQHTIALYQRGTATFALIPGGAATLGHDPDRGWEPEPAERESWRFTAKEYGIRRTIQRHVARATLRPRRVELPPLLVETAAGEQGWESVGIDDAEVQQVLREYGTQSEVTVCRNGVSTRVRRDPNGTVVAERSLARTHAQLAALLAADGFRYPTSDEWEYLCGGGATTLFRWGDHAPCDRYPTDISPAEADWRRRWVVSGGTLEYPEEGFPSDWDLHRRPNAFGLYIASNPYHSELVAEVGTTRGGDGGCTVCGGGGFFVGWLTLATAYFEEDFCRHDPDEPVMPEYTVGRRVLPLG